ncbi:unnamed protein product [Rhodiola kirilowii]
MPDTRNTSLAESLTSLSASFAELAARTQTVETTLTIEVAKNAAESTPPCIDVRTSVGHAGSTERFCQ